MSGNTSSTWTLQNYDYMFKRILYPSPKLAHKIINDVALLQERGTHVVDTFDSTDFTYLKTVYNNHCKNASNCKPVGTHNVPQNAENKHNEIFNFKNMHDKKILFAGLLNRRLTQKGVFAVELKDIARILPHVMEEIYNIDSKMINNPTNYFPLCHILRTFWNSCSECSLEISNENGESKEKCKHIFQEWGINGLENYLETDDDVNNYLISNDPMSEDIYCVVVGKLFGSITFSDYKLTVQAERIYIPNKELRGEINKLRDERKVIGDGFYDSYKEPTVIYKQSDQLTSLPAKLI